MGNNSSIFKNLNMPNSIFFTNSELYITCDKNKYLYMETIISRMYSVSEILERVRLKHKDINTLSTAEIQEILLDLNIKEISVLCRLNTRFESVCKRESFWRSKVISEYGIDETIPGKT